MSGAEALFDRSARYARSRTGKVVHRLTCPRRGRTSMEWTYAEGLSIAGLVDTARLAPWLSFCSHCLSEAQQKDQP